VIALLAITGAAFAGSDFVSSGHPGASMAMAILTGVAVPCDAVTIYLIGAPRQNIP
jgi:hypothetical protein